MSDSSELQEFHRYLSDRIQMGAGGLTPEDVLDEWRQSHPDDESLTLSPQEIQEVIADLESGEEGILLEDFDRQIRLKYGFN